MIPRRAFVFLSILPLALALAVTRPAAQGPPPSTADPIHRPYDQLLDVNVRDGLVYYRALRGSRGAFDRYVASLDVPQAEYDGWARPRQIAFWINAYNAFVIETVLDSYPIHGRSPDYPPDSIRQLPGAFDRKVHRAAGRRATLDEIERSVLAEFNDPRVFLALGRGSVGGGRLRSSAYTSATLESDLKQVAEECVTRQECAAIDGASRYRIFWSIVLPLAVPGLVATFLFVLVFAWNEYLLALFLSGAKAQTLPYVISSQNATRGPQWWNMSVLILIMIVPVIAMAIALERYIARGLLVGAVKG